MCQLVITQPTLRHHRQAFPGIHVDAFADEDLLQGAGFRRFNLILHLHGLDDNDALALGDRIPFAREHAYYFSRH